jgi:hypothetical protein
MHPAVSAAGDTGFADELVNAVRQAGCRLR